MEFAFNNFIKYLLLFGCFESLNIEPLLENVCGKDKQCCFNIFLGKIYFTYKNLSPTLYAVLRQILKLLFKNKHQPLHSSNFTQNLGQNRIIYKHIDHKY